MLINGGIGIGNAGILRGGILRGGKARIIKQARPVVKQNKRKDGENLGD
jgi:hypothetical protein